MRILVTAGPTREDLDPVRYLSNRSSGRMGYALAAALQRLGHQVVLVSGPVELEPPAGVERVPVWSARDMLAACRERWPDMDGLAAVAAVADYRPAKRARGKLKRAEGEGRSLELVPNPDIVRTLARRKGDRRVLGFALESSRGRAHARRKLVDKHLDWIALNGPEAQGASEATLLLLGADGSERDLGPARKELLARRLAALTFPETNA
ncbi:MAG: phosphopantothenoylcysteine decarboxylase [Planctomycetes bacterium]|nr:phosphopantothenoylcysteine decarboxylase [Planctomycetota bacterium]MBL7009352.1 phosphopantothenoylcysteine decarboxylase [Planctomycetota bacterium]